MRVLLDTSAYAELRRGNQHVARLVRGAERVLLSAVVVGELLHGFRNGRRYEQNHRTLAAFMAVTRVGFLPVTLVTADRYGRIMTRLRAKGRPIPTNDAWIAAHAMEAGADLVSFDHHFAEVDGLVWVRPGGGRASPGAGSRPERGSC